MKLPWRYDVASHSPEQEQPLTLASFDGLPEAQEHLRNLAFQILASGDYEYIGHAPNKSTVRRLTDNQQIEYKILPRTD